MTATATMTHRLAMPKKTKAMWENTTFSKAFIPINV